MQGGIECRPPDWSCLVEVTATVLAMRCVNMMSICLTGTAGAAVHIVRHKASIKMNVATVATQQQQKNITAVHTLCQFAASSSVSSSKLV